jgi:hypothetical protein
VANAVSLDHQYTLDDGLGVRTLEHHASYGAVEALEVTRLLTAEPAIEQAIRARASRYALIDRALIAPVRGMQRRGTSLRIIADAPGGLRLSQLLADLEFENVTLPDESLVELAAAVIRLVSDVHRMPGSVAHGAISPAHVVVTHDGAVVLTDSAFGGAFDALQWGREQMWRAFGVALPMSASSHRFDQRTDVTQLAAVVLAIMLRRPLRPEEYPRAVPELVLEATPADGPCHMNALRMWLQQALQLHARSVLSSAIDAHQMFAQVIAAAAINRRGALQPVKEIVAKACGQAVFSNHRAS